MTFLQYLCIQKIRQRPVGGEQSAGEQLRQMHPPDFLTFAGRKSRPVRQQDPQKMQTHRFFRISVTDAIDLIQNNGISHGQLFGQFPAQSGGGSLSRLDLPPGEFPAFVFPAGDQDLPLPPDHGGSDFNDFTTIPAHFKIMPRSFPLTPS